MPANLTPQYFEAEKKFRAAKSPPEKIAALEEMMAVMPKHKGTDHLRAELRSRMAKLTQQLSKKSGAQRSSMIIEKEGAAQVAVVGLPNSGKSSLVSLVTKASPTVADYPLTTHSALPGMMEYEDIKIQLIDTPPLAPQTIQWWLPPMVRRANALLLVIDLSYDPVPQVKEIIKELKKMRVVIGYEAPENTEITTWNKKILIVANKSDLDEGGLNQASLEKEYLSRLPIAVISVKDNISIDELKVQIYKLLNIIRVYTKAPGKKPDMTDPVVLPGGSTLTDAANSIHKDFASKLRYARIWGSGKHDGVMIKKDHILEDGDIIELHI
jgi:uncharacterized protein